MSRVSFALRGGWFRFQDMHWELRAWNNLLKSPLALPLPHFNPPPPTLIISTLASSSAMSVTLQVRPWPPATCCPFSRSHGFGTTARAILNQPHPPPLLHSRSPKTDCRLQIFAQKRNVVNQTISPFSFYFCIFFLFNADGKFVTENLHKALRS